VLHEVALYLAAEGVELAHEAEAAAAVGGDVALVEACEQLDAGLLGDQEERFFVRGVVELVALGVGTAVLVEEPGEGVERAVLGTRVVLGAFFEQAFDGGLGGADGPVEEEDAFVGAVALGGGAEQIDQRLEREVEAVDGVGLGIGRVGEKSSIERRLS